MAACGDGLSMYSALHGPAVSLVTKLLIPLLLLLRYCHPSANPCLQAGGAGLTPTSSFNDVLQSAVNSIVWPNGIICYVLIGTYFTNQLYASTLYSVSPILSRVVVQDAWNATDSLTGSPQESRIPFLDTFAADSSSAWLHLPSMPFSGEWDVRDVITSQAYAAHAPDSCPAHSNFNMQETLLKLRDALGWNIWEETSVGASETYSSADDDVMRALLAFGYKISQAVAPVLPIFVGFSQFRSHERLGHVAVQDYHLPKGIFRSFLFILAVEAAINLATLPASRWRAIIDETTLSMLADYNWNWTLMIALLVKWVLWIAGCAISSPLVVLLFLALASVLVYTARAKVAYNLSLISLLHAFLSLCALLSIHRLSYVALARLTAIQAHQYAFALKKVTNSVLTQYRYSGTVRSRSESPRPGDLTNTPTPGATGGLKTASLRVPQAFASQSTAAAICTPRGIPSQLRRVVSSSTLSSDVGGGLLEAGGGGGGGGSDTLNGGLGLRDVPGQPAHITKFLQRLTPHTRRVSFPDMPLAPTPTVAPTPTLASSSSSTSTSSRSNKPPNLRIDPLAVGGQGRNRVPDSSTGNSSSFRFRAHTKDISAAVVALSAGVVPSTPLERLEQYKMATAGEKRLRKIATLVWSVLLIHATFMLSADLYSRNDPSVTAIRMVQGEAMEQGRTVPVFTPSPPPHAGMHDETADNVDGTEPEASHADDGNVGESDPGVHHAEHEDSQGSDSSTARPSNFSIVLSHAAHLVHLAYMWAFVQKRIQRAEQALVAAWEEVNLLHVRLPTSTIKKEESQDWLVYLKARRETSAPTWPTRLLSTIGILRFALPALLTMNPTVSLQENIVDALKAVAVGGKYVIFKDKVK